MKRIVVLLCFFRLGALAQTDQDELVNLKDYIPDIVVDLRYNTVDNFASQKLYSTDEALLMLKAAKGLVLIQDSLRRITHYNGKDYPQGLGLKIYDGYRPRAIQYLMFEIFPDPTFVADPTTGSIHNRGGAVDLSIVDRATGEELQMPTVFDWFGPEAGHDYQDLPADAIANRLLLKTMMTQVGGFEIYDAEWWHYSIPGASNYPLLDFQMK
ncbi:MAG: M15 family metallopeptidase [Candidatus Delongbacteria bacterium]|nr:M15 family metallopeptidase [Candidatus Delongbacteria bacterium]